MDKNGMKSALMILECYAAQNQPLSVQRLSTKTALPETRVRAIVEILEKRGYLSRTKTDKYNLNTDFPLL